MKIVKSSAVALILSAGLAGAAYAAQSEIDLSSLTNANLQTYTDGTAYPTAGSTVTIGAASFLVSSDAGLAGTTGAIQVSSPSDSFVVPINQAGYSTVYVLVNSAFGVLGETVGSLVFQRLGWRYGYDLFGWKGSTSVTTGQLTTMSRPTFTARRLIGDGVRFDAYEYFLPATFAGNTLTSITLNGAADTGVPDGEPFIAGITLATGGIAFTRAFDLGHDDCRLRGPR